ncbi:SAM-dependent methyltransferase [Nocardiopsis terrae]|uniref:Methylation protein EvaC n=1 Tax=Nocardiopsis terrae TaxID=372655 RepID=A0ABR9HA96_9ACTN|nr:class I SAM-dependent methyltransferase [Nocardiopsis terrae]MBE1455952.1 methylation protein EvaC [Nocardiopsis terrae]GHC96533.1 SAM-dependent methyltransferase [Nocardiopsis terrae]
MTTRIFCRVCDGDVEEFVDFGRQPVSNAFVVPGEEDSEYFFPLAVGACSSCHMVQLVEEVPRERMFHQDYPYLSSGSVLMRNHWERTAKSFLSTELTGDDPFVVELGCNDGVLLETIAHSGVRHLGVEPSGGVADIAAGKGIRVRKDFFEESVAARIREQEGPADVVFAANTLCHIPYIGSVLRGVRDLLSENGVFVFEDPYLGDIVDRTSFDQIYDEHFYFFSAHSVRETARLHSLELVDVERLPVHGGEVRYTLAPAGSRTPSEAVAGLLAEEAASGLTLPATLTAFGERVERIRADLRALLTRLRDEGSRVMAYGATAKSATVLNHCGIGPDLVECVVDTTPAKQGRLTPGSHIPVVPADRFGAPYPDHVLLLAWNHAEEIMAKEEGFRAAGGQWITYVPEVRVTGS